MNAKNAKMRHSLPLAVIVIILQLISNATAQYDDDASAKKLRLQDLENEQNQRELMMLQQEQPPLSKKTTFHLTAQNVRPLDQKITLEKPMRFGGEEFLSNAASNLNFGIRTLANNNLDGDADSDIVSYSHDEPPFPFNLRRPQLELLSSGGAGYSLSSADVLVPPFRDDAPQHQISGEQRPLGQIAPGRYVRPFGIQNNRMPPPYIGSETPASPADPASIQFSANNELPEVPAGTIEYSSGYLPLNQFSSQRPVIRYGSPHADFRRPDVYSQSNQLAFAPTRSESGTLMPGRQIPYPPSFISITTKRPGTEFSSNGVPPAVRPLGRALMYGRPFRPSAIDPVPDFFANRQSKSLLDSYIPSWVVSRMIEQKRHNNQIPYNRHLKRSDHLNTEIQNTKSDDGNPEQISSR